MRIMLIPAAIETTDRTVPSGLRHAPWDSRQMIARYRTLIRRLAQDLSRQVAYISIANEADVYFSAHPSQLPAFLRFTHVEISQLRRLLPWAEVGVTVTYNGLAGDHPQVARTLARLGNATIVTYYPLAGGYRVRSPRSPLRDIPRMIRLSRGRKLVLQEAGYPSTTRLGSSPSAQAAFVRNVFTAWARAPRGIPFLSFYSLFDLPARDCATTRTRQRSSAHSAFATATDGRSQHGRRSKQALTASAEPETAGPPPVDTLGAPPPRTGGPGRRSARQARISEVGPTFRGGLRCREIGTTCELSRGPASHDRGRIIRGFSCGDVWGHSV